jgi:hypothetical protein
VTIRFYLGKHREYKVLLLSDINLHRQNGVDI